MKKEDIVKIVKQIIVWGFGAVLAIAGATVLVVCSIGVVEANYPAWLIAGSILFGFGSIIYILEWVLNWLARMRGK